MSLIVYRDSVQGKVPIGTLDSEGFAYDSSYLNRSAAHFELGISERLPLTEARYSSTDIAAFFTGLLPEGEVLGNLSQLFQVPRSDYLTLIGKLGCESIGGLTFTSPDITNDSIFEAHYEPLSAKDIEAIKDNPTRAATQTASETRLSLAGAQSKVAWYLPRELDAAQTNCDDWQVPHETAPSTHIIKVSRKGEEDLAINELACSLLAESCGIKVAPITALDVIPGAIAVKRYDRKWAEDEGRQKLIRLHQEDFCQALGLMPFYKYQPAGTDADYIAFCADLINSCCQNPNADRLEFAKRVAFNYVIGNSDTHLKNSALLYAENWTSRRLSPLYDVTCIPLSGYSTKMAFNIGDHRELAEIDARDIMQIALSADVALSLFDEAVREIIDGLEGYKPTAHGELLTLMIDRIIDNAKPRLAVLKDYLGL